MSAIQLLDQLPQDRGQARHERLLAQLELLQRCQLEALDELSLQMA